MTDPFEIGRALWEARIRAAWSPESAELRLKANPWPRHMADERAAEHDLALAEAKALLKRYSLTPKEGGRP